MSNPGVHVCITLMEAELKHLLCSFLGNGFPFWDAQKLFPLEGCEHETQGKNHLIFIGETGDNLVRDLAFHLTIPLGRSTCVFIIYLIEIHCKKKHLKSEHVFLVIDFYAFFILSFATASFSKRTNLSKTHKVKKISPFSVLCQSVSS